MPETLKHNQPHKAMTLYELIHKHEFETVIPHLIAIDPEKVSINLCAFKEAFDGLRRIEPGKADGKQIVITTEVDTDNDGNEIERFLHASGCEGDFWEASLAKEVIFGTSVGEEKALAQILWHMTCRGFSSQADPLESLPENEYERQAKEYECKGKVQRLIDRIMFSEPGYASCPENRRNGILDLNPAAEQVTSRRFRYLFDTVEISTTELYSRSALKDRRTGYISEIIANYYKAGPTEYTKAIALIETSVDCPLRISEYKSLQASLGRITGRCEHTSFLFGKNPDLGYDIHVLIVFSR